MAELDLILVVHSDRTHQAIDQSLSGLGLAERWVKGSRAEVPAQDPLTSRGMRPWYQAWLRRSVLLSLSSSSNSLCSFSGDESRMYFSLENWAGDSENGHPIRSPLPPSLPISPYPR